MMMFGEDVLNREFVLVAMEASKCRTNTVINWTTGNKTARNYRNKAIFSCENAENKLKEFLMVNGIQRFLMLNRRAVNKNFVKVPRMLTWKSSVQADEMPVTTRSAIDKNWKSIWQLLTHNILKFWSHFMHVVNERLTTNTFVLKMTTDDDNFEKSEWHQEQSDVFEAPVDCNHSKRVRRWLDGAFGTRQNEFPLPLMMVANVYRHVFVAASTLLDEFVTRYTSPGLFVLIPLEKRSASSFPDTSVIFSISHVERGG